ncbi:Fe-S cluster assembly protein SufD [Calidifontibacter terrae]
MTLITPERNQAAGHIDPAAAFVPDQSRAERKTSFEVSDFPVPHGREEEWRFTPVDKLGQLFTDEATGNHLTWTNDLPQGATLGEMSVQEWQSTTTTLPADRAAAVAATHSGGLAVLDIAANAELEGPVRLRLTGQQRQVVHGHLLVRAGVNSHATVVIVHDGTSDYSEVLSVEVADGANLTLVTTAEWDDEATHLGQYDAVVGRDATYRHIAVSLGGEIVRINSNVKYSGPGGQATLLGVYFADAGQHLEHRSFVDHNTPRCTSLVTYKGALQGDSAHTVWVGDVLIRKEAEGIETYELNRNLVLTDGARADSVPNLEIETGDIEGAGHASSTGRFDDEQLFYLQARGIPESEARRLVVRGFFADVIAKIGVPEICDPLMKAIEDELAATPS